MVLAAIFVVGMMLLEAQTTFKKVFSVVAWSSCALELVATIATVGVVLISDLTDFDPTKSSVLLTSLENSNHRSKSNRSSAYCLKTSRY